MSHLNDLGFYGKWENRQKDLWKHKSQRKIISKFLEERLGVIKNNIYEEIKATQLCLVLDVTITTTKFKMLKFGKFNESYFIIYGWRMPIHFHNDNFFSLVSRTFDLTLFDLMIRNIFFIKYGIWRRRYEGVNLVEMFWCAYWSHFFLVVCY